MIVTTPAKNAKICTRNVFKAAQACSLDRLVCLRDLQLIVIKTMSCSTSTKLEGVNHGDSSAELAKLYSELSDLQRKHGEELIKKLSLAKNVKILDLGCGTGYLSSLLADSVGPGATVVAIDPNKGRLEFAKKQYSRPNLLFVEANDVSLPKDQYDLVFSNYVLHWIENKAAVLKKVHQNLKPGGQFAFLLYLSINLQSLSRWTIWWVQK